MPKGRGIMALVLVTLWLLGTVYAFWWFQFRDIRTFELEAAALQELTFVQPPVSTKAADGRPLVVHFRDPDCACTRFNDAHVRQLVQAYAARGIDFRVHELVPAGENPAELFGRGMEAVRVTKELLAALPAVPAAAVWDERGNLVYLGPYASGAVCVTGEGRYVENVLDALLRDEQIETAAQRVKGCFCRTLDKREWVAET